MDEEPLVREDIYEMLGMTGDQMDRFLEWEASESRRLESDLRELTVFYPPANYFKQKNGEEEFGRN